MPYEVDKYTVSLLHFDDGINDETGKVWTATGNAGISREQSKFGKASLFLNGTSQYLSTNNIPDFNFGISDYAAFKFVTQRAAGTSDDGKGKYLLVVTLAEEVEREYALGKAELDNFFSWYTSKADGNGKAYYTFDKIFNRKDYLVYDKILTFEVTDFSKYAL